MELVWRTSKAYYNALKRAFFYVQEALSLIAAALICKKKNIFRKIFVTLVKNNALYFHKNLS